MRTLTALFLVLLTAAVFPAPAPARVSIGDDHLIVDGEKQPQLFGGELQYFRLRGGYGPNVPREKVIATWNRALDRMVEAKMNTISFYIPWDFHEYEEGKFDFVGTVDQDGDGNPDYPSRDVKTFFKLIEAHGIRRIMARPGPYINAEWGFLGFGAIPEWFHHKYPDSHMQTSWGWKQRNYDYLNPDLLRHTKLWFKAVYDQVLKEQMGPGRPVVFLQLDNETNYQWSSLYNQDYSPASIARYRDFLKSRYGTIEALNQAHSRSWGDWSQVRAPARSMENIAEDRDWYRFNDNTLYIFLNKVRQIWNELGVDEPQVLFTLAESYNATWEGLLPNYVLRNAPGMTGMMTVNLYPKTYQTGDNTLMNLPFKTDLDVKSADEASDTYLGSHQEWVMGPEIQGGWWRGTPVSRESRQQTYLSVVGHGMKALYIYYLNEGYNWGAEWGYDNVAPLFHALRYEWNVQHLPVERLSNEFWGELQARSDRTLVMGFDARGLMTRNQPLENSTLFFDAPLDGDAQPRDHFQHLKILGERLFSPYRDFLGRAREVVDPVAIVKDSTAHLPTGNWSINNIRTQSDWAGGMLGYLFNADRNPSILFGDMSSDAMFAGKTLIHLDTGVNHERTIEVLRKGFEARQGVVNFLEDSVAQALGFARPRTQIPNLPGEPVTFYVGPRGDLRVGNEVDSRAVQINTVNPIYTYDLAGSSCEGILYWRNQAVGYRCVVDGKSFVQIGMALFEGYNTDIYGSMQNPREKRQFLTMLLNSLGAPAPKLQMSAEAERVSAFARQDPERKVLWITVKTGTRVGQVVTLKLNAELVREALVPAARYQVKDLIGQGTQLLTGAALSEQGFRVELGADGSTVYAVEPVIR